MATRLLDQGVDPKVVGAILMNGGGQSVIAMPAPSNNGGFDAKMMMEMFTKIMDAKNDRETDKTIAKLEAEIADLKKRPTEVRAIAAPVDPIKSLSETLGVITKLNVTWREMGLIRDPVAATGESIEALREGNRHKERMLELQETITDGTEKRMLVASLPEKVGRGIASYIMKSKGAQAPAEEYPGMKVYECRKCKAHIPVPTDADPEVITCGSCGTEYRKDGTVSGPEKPADNASGNNS